ncbi:S8 family serine peptidase [Roseivirga sp. BDSF3-8]|uniref:S8 family serine peptidase n=1 Tax=Roseivirga sp. BDSF3-8 TaxID=3241598 RepID=UPI003531C6AB
MIRYIYLLVWLSVMLGAQTALARQEAPYAADRIVVRIGNVHDKDNAQSRTGTTINRRAVLARIQKRTGARSIMQPFDYLPASPKGRPAARSSTSHPLEDLYIIHLPEGTDLQAALQQARATPGVLYAERYHLPQPLLVPDDPEAIPGGQQDYLSPIRAYQAWDIERGSPDIKIGILDTGVRYSHPDLAGNMAFNDSDPPNGVDDDGDGYVDNYRGWDFADGDNDPHDPGNSQHGTAVAGLAAGVPQNGIGMAGTGFYSSFLPIKIYTDEGYNFNRGYEAIAYAADQGCQVINLSWGGQGRYSQYIQDIINYAVLDRDAVVIAAAGNTAGDLEFFPAAYDYVLSVGAVDINDKKTSWATYHSSVDIVAPGDFNYTTYLDDNYASFWGSSFAAPLVSGAAALIRSRYPGMSAVEVMEQLRITSDDIYYLPENAPFLGLMGKGRLNMERALTETHLPSVRARDIEIKGPYGSYLFPGDEAALTASFTNYLADASLLRVTLSSMTEGVTIGQDFVRIGDLAKGQHFTNDPAPFVINLSDELENGSVITLRLDYEGINYRDFQVIRFQLVDDPITVYNGQLGASFGKKGEVAYQESWQGEGILHQNTVISYNAGIIMASGSGQEADNLPNDFRTFARNKDFNARSSYSLYNNSIADPDVRLQWTEDKEWGLLVEQKVYADTTSATYEDYLLVEYRITNRSDSLINDFHFGLYTDFDLGEGVDNLVRSIDSLQLQYTQSDTAVAGVALLQGGEWKPNALVVRDKNFKRVDIPIVFDRETKRNLLLQETPRYESGAEGNDVAQLAGVQVGNLNAYESKTVTLVLTVGSDAEQLARKVQEAKTIMQELASKPPVGITMNSCPGLPVSISPPGGRMFRYYRDVAGTDMVFEDATFTSPGFSRDTTVYYRQADSLWLGPVGAIEVHITEPRASFEWANDTLMLDESGPAAISLQNTSEDASIYSWDFGNGYYSSKRSPSPLYETPGTYTIHLTATAATGCSDVAQKNLVVVQRNEKPGIPSTFRLCPGESATLEADNSSLLKMYSTWPAGAAVAQGAQIKTGSLYKDTVFYITNAAGPYESLPVTVRVNVTETDASFTLLPDTTGIHANAAGWLRAEGTADDYYWYKDNVYLGHGPQIWLPLTSEGSFRIRLETTYASGCSELQEEVFTSVASPLPAVQDTAVCRGENLLITPEGGEYFAFFSDAMGTKLIRKGTSLLLPALTRDTTVYIAGLDSLLLSSMVAVDITMRAPEATFTYTADSSSSWGVRDITFLPDNQGALNYHWDFGDGTSSDEVMPIHFFENAGRYEVMLTVTATDGCSASEFRILTLSEITALPEEEDKAVSLYPNPARTGWTLDFGRIPDGEVFISLFNSTGQLLQQKTLRGMPAVQFDRDQLPAGIYHVRYQGKNSEGTVRLILR